MDINKYNMIPNEYTTAREIGLSAQTLLAMSRRGLVKIQEGSPKKYRKSNNPAVKIYLLCEQNKNDYDTYFTLRKSTEKLGMLCSISNGTVVDCWGKPYDLTNVNKIEFRTKEFNI